MKGDCFIAIFANSVVCLIALLMASATMFYLIPHTVTKLHEPFFRFNEIYFLATFVMWCWTWFYCTFSDPGRVIDDLKKRGYYDQIRKGDIPHFLEHFPICPKCNVPRPPGAVHCEDCDTCVLRQDHHCGVIGQCVGDKNFKAFIQSFFYGGILSLESGIMGLYYILKTKTKDDIDVVGLLICVYGFVLCAMLLAFGYSFFSMGRSNNPYGKEKIPMDEYIKSFGTKPIDFLIPIQKLSTNLAWPGVEWEFETPLALL